MNHAATRLIPSLRPNPLTTAHHDIFSSRLSLLNARLSAHLGKNEPEATWELFLQMHRIRSDLDAYTFSPVIGACAALSDKLRGQQVHSLFIKTCSDSETIAKTAFIDMYFKCNSSNNSVKVFEEMENKDSIALNTMITGLVNNDKPRYALHVFEEMCEEKLKFSGFVLCSVLKACSLLKDLQLGKQIHALVIGMGRDMLVLGTALINLYSNCGLTDEALHVFRSINCRKDNAIYNALVSGFVQNGKYKESLLILSNMKPNEIALTSGLAICSMYSDLFIGKQIHCVAIRFEFDSDVQLSNALLDMYAKCGKISTARLLFDWMPHKTVFTWTSIIDGYGSHGCGVEAYSLFKAMEGSGVSPNSVTFLAVLSACGHSGLVEEGRLCFISMRGRYGVDPGPEHYACFIDLLGRAGLMEEVWDLFNDMHKKSIPITGVVLATLLNASRVNLDVEKGEFAAKSLIELEPDKPGNLVAISNFYAAIERWGRVEDLRNVMDERIFRKQAGSSWMLVKGRKASGRGEEMAVEQKFAFGPLEEDAIIKHRLLTRTTTTRGEPPLKKLQKKFISFALEIESDADNYNTCEKLYKALLQEMTTFELPLLKSRTVIDANLREKDNFNELQGGLHRQISQAQSDIEDLKKQLEQSKIERKHKEECEAIRKLIAMQRPRSDTQKMIAELEKEIAVLEAEHTAASRTLELRKKQFSLLLHVVDELQNTIEDEQKSMAEELRLAMEEQTISMDDPNQGSDAMAVD